MGGVRCDAVGAAAILCVVAGHRWQAAPDEHEIYPVFSCRRCGRRYVMTREHALDGALRRWGETVETVLEDVGNRWQPGSRRRRRS